MLNKKNRLFIIALLLVSVTAIAAIVVAVLERQQVKQYEASIAQVNDEISSNRVSGVYVATTAIKAGEVLNATITEENGLSNIGASDIYAAMEQAGNYIYDDPSGMIALVDIEAGSPLQPGMLGEQDITKDTRKVEVTTVNLTSTQQNNDIVDIRIIFPDGTNYTVMSKKKIMNYPGTGTIFDLYMNEDEILRFQSAIVDAATLGAKLYTTAYVQPTLQDEALPFYPVKQSTIDLINADPNVLAMATNTLNSEARHNLEERMLSLRAAAGEDTSLISAYFEQRISTQGPAGTTTEDGEAVEGEAAEETEAANG